MTETHLSDLDPARLDVHDGTDQREPDHGWLEPGTGQETGQEMGALMTPAAVWGMPLWALAPLLAAVLPDPARTLGLLVLPAAVAAAFYARTTRLTPRWLLAAMLGATPLTATVAVADSDPCTSPEPPSWCEQYLPPVADPSNAPAGEGLTDGADTSPVTGPDALPPGPVLLAEVEPPGAALEWPAGLPQYDESVYGTGRAETLVQALELLMPEGWKAYSAVPAQRLRAVAPGPHYWDAGENGTPWRKTLESLLAGLGMRAEADAVQRSLLIVDVPPAPLMAQPNPAAGQGWAEPSAQAMTQPPAAHPAEPQEKAGSQPPEPAQLPEPAQPAGPAQPDSGGVPLPPMQAAARDLARSLGLPEADVVGAAVIPLVEPVIEPLQALVDAMSLEIIDGDSIILVHIRPAEGAMEAAMDTWAETAEPEVQPERAQQAQPERLLRSTAPPGEPLPDAVASSPAGLPPIELEAPRMAALWRRYTTPSRLSVRPLPGTRAEVAWRLLPEGITLALDGLGAYRNAVVREWALDTVEASPREALARLIPAGHCIAEGAFPALSVQPCPQEETEAPRTAPADQ